MDAYNPSRLTYTFDRVLPTNLVGAVMYTTDLNVRGGNSVIERNNVQDKSCCFGMDIWGWAGSTVRGNYIRRIGLAGIGMIQSLMVSSWTTPPLVDMTFRNNVIDGTKMTPDWWLHEMGGIETVGFGPDANGNPDLMSIRAHRNIALLDNFIADPGRAAIWMANTEGGNVAGNYLLRPNERPELPVPHPPHTDVLAPIVLDATSSGITVGSNIVDQVSGRVFVTDTQYRDLAAYPPGGTVRLNAYRLGLPTPTVTLTDADGVTVPLAVEGTAIDRLDVRLPAPAGLGGAFVTVTAGAAKYFGTLFIDSQDNVPAVNGCTYDASLSTTSVSYSVSTVPVLVVTQPGCGYRATASDPFVTAGASGNGTAVISVAFSANTGPPRTTTIEIAGQPITITQSAFAMGGPFTDLTLSGVVVKAIHIGELRVRIDAARLRLGLAAFPWTDPVIDPRSTLVRSIHVEELRTALNQAYSAAARPPPQYTDGIVAGGTPVRAVHITELRGAVMVLERP